MTHPNADEPVAATDRPGYLGHLARDSDRFLTAVLAADPAEPVPTCPGWVAADLLWHLAEVQWFWGEIVRTGASDPDEATVATPDRPDDLAGLEALYRRASADLGDLLAAADPATPVWTWADEQTVGFVRRRQAHEALVHRLDAELTAGLRTPLDPGLAADGVDEMLRVMYGGAPAWGTFTPDDGRTLRVRATDTGHSWLVTLGRFTGTSPNTGTVFDEGAFDVAGADDGSPVSATLAGTAEDLDCVLWNRPPVGTVERSGDAGTLAGLDAVVGSGIQ